MTVLNYSEVVNFSRQEIWRRLAGFSKCPRYFDWVEKAECLYGNPSGPDGTWRFHILTSTGLWLPEVMITEWLEGERIALRPLGNSGIRNDMQLFQIVIDLIEKPHNHCQIKICCEYKPDSKWGRLKNLFFQRRRCLDVMAQSVDALSRAASADAWRQSLVDKVKNESSKTGNVAN